MAEVIRKKEEGRRKKEEGKRKKKEGKIVLDAQTILVRYEVRTLPLQIV
ncbi:hypothetical protein NDI43_20425 [Microcoleus vaginatus GB2-A3]